MRVHVLGVAAGCPGSIGACPGYLIESGDHRILVDCGPGVLGPLQRICDIDQLGSIILSHAHADHLLDLVPLAYGLMMRCQTSDADRSVKRVPVFLPKGARATLAAVSSALGHRHWQFAPSERSGPAHRQFLELLAAEPDFLLALLPVTEYLCDASWSDRGIEVTAFPARHGPPAASLRFETPDATFVYSGDTAFTTTLIEAARGADIFLCEATLTPDDLGIDIGHLRPSEAGRIARDADAGELVLTHRWPWADAALNAWMIAEAAREFDGPVRLARVGDVLAVGPRNPADREPEETSCA